MISIIGEALIDAHFDGEVMRPHPCHLRHTFATEALAAGISTWELARLMGTSVAMIDRTYGHLARDAEESIRARLDARAAQPGVDLASGGDGASGE